MRTPKPNRWRKAELEILDAKDLPSPLEYLAPKGTWKDPVGNIGLRLGTYADKDKGGNQHGRERESHHITQYLLLEYFANKSATYKPFKLLDGTHNPYPGLKSKGTEVDTFRHTGEPPMPIADFEAKRGGKMPAILLARITHRTGGLHVTAKADDFDPPADSPAGAVDSIFEEKLGGRNGPYRVAEEGGISQFNSFKQSVGEPKVEETIYIAMQDTYAWMKRVMHGPLKDGLQTIEAKYFNALADQKGGTMHITPAELSEVGAAAVLHNNELMAKGGWKG